MMFPTYTDKRILLNMAINNTEKELNCNKGTKQQFKEKVKEKIEIYKELHLEDIENTK